MKLQQFGFKVKEVLMKLPFKNLMCSMLPTIGTVISVWLRVGIVTNKAINKNKFKLKLS
jgi:hypothetical protein